MENSEGGLAVVEGGRRATAPGFERTFDVESEGAVLSSLLWDPRMLDDVRGILGPERFYSESHRLMYDAILELADAGEAVNVTSVQSRLRGAGTLAKAGGSAYLTEIVGCAPVLHVRHLLTHARAVRELWVRRKLEQLATITGATCRESDLGMGVVLERMRARVDELAQVLATGFHQLDRITAGLHEELLVVGARPGMGKTSFATAVAVHVARRGEGVFVASLETNDVQLMTRILCAEARIEVAKARVGALTPIDWSRATDAASRLHDLPIWINETSGLTVAELTGHCRRASLELSRQGKTLGLVVVDYVQLLRAPRFGMKREEVVGENARALKALAQELGVTVLALAQLNRDVDKRTDRHPQLSDLRESGELEQCARTVLMLYREDYYAARRPGYRPTGLVEVQVAKQNNGPTGSTMLRFDAPCTRFESLDEDAGWAAQ